MPMLFANLQHGMGGQPHTCNQYPFMRASHAKFMRQEEDWSANQPVANNGGEFLQPIVNCNLVLQLC